VLHPSSILSNHSTFLRSGEVAVEIISQGKCTSAEIGPMHVANLGLPTATPDSPRHLGGLGAGQRRLSPSLQCRPGSWLSQSAGRKSGARLLSAASLAFLALLLAPTPLFHQTVTLRENTVWQLQPFCALLPTNDSSPWRRMIRVAGTRFSFRANLFRAPDHPGGTEQSICSPRFAAGATYIAVRCEYEELT
jgi:hypothetical protein